MTYDTSQPSIYLCKLLIIFSIVGDQQYHPSACYMLIVIIILLGIARPYKQRSHYVVNVIFFTSMLIVYLSITITLEGIYFHDILYSTLRRSLNVIATDVPTSVRVSYISQSYLTFEDKESDYNLNSEEKEEKIQNRFPIACS